MQEEKPKPNYLLREARKRRGWTQEALAQKIGLADSQAVSLWERGVHLPSPTIRTRLCELLEETPERLGLIEEEQRKVPQDITVVQSLPSIETDMKSLWTKSYIFNWRDENRDKMLQRVKSIWVEGMLTHSLQGGPMITLDLQVQAASDALLLPWQQEVQDAGRQRREGHRPTSLSTLRAHGHLLVDTA